MATPIWQPKFSTRMVLVDRTKVREGKNYLYFVADRNHPDLYSYDGTRVRNECQLSTNGKIYCYNIPLDWLVSEGDLPEELIPIREKEYKKFQKFTKKDKR